MRHHMLIQHHNNKARNLLYCTLLISILIILCGFMSKLYAVATETGIKDKLKINLLYTYNTDIDSDNFDNESYNKSNLGISTIYNDLFEFQATTRTLAAYYNWFFPKKRAYLAFGITYDYLYHNMASISFNTSLANWFHLKYNRISWYEQLNIRTSDLKNIMDNYSFTFGVRLKIY